MPRNKVFANIETKVAHDGAKLGDQCRESEIKPGNRVHFDSPQEALDAGYKLCKSCWPDGV